MRVVAENLGKRFNQEWIFRNLNYAFEAGNTYAVTGPNGSGKSTLLQLLWGQLPASKGSISYSAATGGIAPEEIFKSLAIAAPYLELIDEFTLDEMVRFHFRFKQTRYGLTPSAVIDQLDLRPASEKRVGNFSSGMRQRLKLGLAFFSECPLLFLDEPTTNLDEPSVAWYWKQFDRLPQDALVIIASNHETEYPKTAKKINILDYK
jgi:ABC-type multidrug transport system ATPase subunit